MDRSRLTGIALLAGAAIELLLFLNGIRRRSYAAIAIPVTSAVAGLTVLAMWVGWTMLTTETDLPEPEVEEQPV